MRTLSTTNYSTHFCSDARSERGVKLNVEKFKLRQGEVRIIGHVATSDGLGIDPTMVKAIIDMPNLTDVPGVQRLFGLAQYLAKFLPHLSDTTRDLTRNDAEWIWEISQQNAPHTLKKAVASTPVLRYYNLAVRCVTIRIWHSIDAEPPNGGLCITCSDALGNKIR